MKHPSDALPRHTRWPLPWAAALAFFVLLQCCVMAYTSPLGIPPDELAHLSYIRDAADGGLLPDYANGRIGSSKQGNYLTHPPLYYSLLGGISRLGGLDAFEDYRILRLISAQFVGLGFFLWLLAARNLGVSPAMAALATLAACATPMFAYAAGSINNDTLLYLGTGLFFFGVSREYVAQHRDRWAAATIVSGLIVTFLTKATGSAFIIFFIAACLLPHYRQLVPLVRDRRLLKIFCICALVCGTYFIYALARFGSFMPAPAPLYPESPPTHAMVPIAFARSYLAIMWERLPIIMSHASFSPFVSDKGVVAFYGMLVVSAISWIAARLGARSRGIPTILIRATDAFVIACIVTIVLHIAVTYRGYLHAGLMGGLQPRYFAFLIPSIWIIGAALEQRRVLRVVTSIALLICAAIAFWTSVPFTVAKQVPAVQTGKAGATSSPPGTGAALRGHLDEFRLEGGTLTLRGWAFDAQDSSALRRILVMRADKSLASFPTNQERPDVAKALGDPNALNSGFVSAVTDIPAKTRLCEIQIAGEADDGDLLWLRRSTCSD